MMRENQRLLNQLHVFTDGLAVFLAMLVSYWLRFSLFRGVKGMPLNYYIWLGVVAAAGIAAVGIRPISSTRVSIRQANLFFIETYSFTEL